MIEHVGWIKSIGGFLEAGFNRLTTWIGRRKPKLYVHFETGTCIWCIARSGPEPSATEYMQLMCSANITHDDLKQAMVIVDAYPVGTTSQIRAMEEFTIPPEEMVKERIMTIVGPVVAKKGKPWTGRIVLVDQFLRKHKTQKVAFKWVGSSSAPSTR
ncbi:MAG: hypothetical protein WA224_11465 [Candidatus Acidiferrales bacterium]